MNRQTVEKRLKGKFGAHSCSDTQRLSATAYAFMWFDESKCEDFSEQLLGLACSNESYKSFEISFEVRSLNGVIRIGQPSSGSMFVKKAPRRQLREFDHDYTTVTAVNPGRKDTCIVDWFLADGNRRDAIKTTVPIDTARA